MGSEASRSGHVDDVGMSTGSVDKRSRYETKRALTPFCLKGSDPLG